MPAPTGLPEWSIATAKVLGWSEPGLVIVATTMIVIFLVGLLVWFIVFQLPGILQRGYDRSSGIAAFLIGLVFVVVVILATALSWIVLLMGAIGALYLLSLGRNWWHGGSR